MEKGLDAGVVCVKYNMSIINKDNQKCFMFDANIFDAILDEKYATIRTTT